MLLRGGEKSIEFSCLYQKSGIAGSFTCYAVIILSEYYVFSSSAGASKETTSSAAASQGDSAASQQHSSAAASAAGSSNSTISPSITSSPREEIASFALPKSSSALAVASGAFLKSFILHFFFSSPLSKKIFQA